MHSNKKSKVRGFTLIELLVVISIIALLSSVVLASLNNARKKGVDGKIIQQITQLRNLNALYPGYLGKTGTYTEGADFWSSGTCEFVRDNWEQGSVFQDATIGSIILNTIKLVDPTFGFAEANCGVSETTWAIAVPLKIDSNKSWCVDSSQVSKLENVSATSIVLQVETSGVYTSRCP